MISDAIALYEMISKARASVVTKSALFDSTGARIHGSEDINVRVHQDADSAKDCWYSIEQIADYEFLRFPLNPSGVVEALATEDCTHDTYFRYVAVSHPPLRPSQSPPQARVKFMVVGYRPGDLLALMEGHAAT